VQHRLSAWVQEQVEGGIEHTTDRLQRSAETWSKLGRIFGSEAARLWDAVDSADLQLLNALALRAGFALPHVWTAPWVQGVCCII